MIRLEDERFVIQKVFEKEHAITDVEAFLFADRPVQLWSNECFAEEADHTDFPVGDHEEVASDAIVGCICLKDWGRHILEEIDGLLKVFAVFGPSQSCEVHDP